jgi:hypothetical protein
VNGTFVSATPIDVGPGATKATLGSPLLAQVSLRIAVDGKPANPSSPLLGQLLSYRLLGSLRSASVVRNEPVIFTNVPSGRYEVKASQGGPYATSSLKVNGVAQAGVMVEVPEAGNVRIEAIADASASDVTGRLLVNDRPKGGTIVMLVQRDAWQRAGAYRFDQSASDGTFVWRNVSQGEYLMFAFEDGVPADYDDPDTIRRMLPIAQPLKVGDSAPKIELKFLPLPSAK